MGERVAGGAGVGEAHVLEGERGSVRRGLRLEGSVREGGGGLKDLVDATGARRGLGEKHDEVGELEELDERLAHIAHECDELALREAADVHL